MFHLKLKTIKNLDFSFRSPELFFLRCKLKTSSGPGPLGGVKNLRVTDPTMTSLNVDWAPADGAVRLYKVFYVPSAGGREEMVRCLDFPAVRASSCSHQLFQDF